MTYDGLAACRSRDQSTRRRTRSLRNQSLLLARETTGVLAISLISSDRLLLRLKGGHTHLV